MSSKFSFQRIPQPTPLICKKGIIPGTPLPEPDNLNIVMRWEPSESVPDLPAFSASYQLARIPTTDTYIGQSAPSGTYFSVVMHLDFPSAAAHITTGYFLDDAMRDFTDYTPFQCGEPPGFNMAEPYVYEAYGHGRFTWFVYR